MVDMIESQLPNSSEFIIFSYGSNSVDQLEERLEARPHPLKCEWLNGFERAFFGTSKKWETPLFCDIKMIILSTFVDKNQRPVIPK